MRAFTAFLKKEFTENIRTYRFFVLMTVFLLFGFMNPVAAKVMPDLLQSFLPDGMTITLAPPTAIDSWMQFFKNVSQMGFIVLVILYSSLMANEFSKGTLVNMLTKGLSRPVVVIAKICSSIAVWTLSYLICAVVTAFYTAVFWESAMVEHLLLALFGLWLFGILLLNLSVLGGIIFKNMMGSMMFTGITVVVMTLINIFPSAQPFNPSTISTSNVALITGIQSQTDFVTSIGVTVLMCVIVVIGSILIFNREQV